MIYLDYNATSPLLPQVQEAMAEIEALPLNASSVHAMGRKAKQLLEDARTTLANHFSSWPDEVIFTANGTEANNLALKGIEGRKLMVAATEHSSVIEIVKALQYPSPLMGGRLGGGGASNAADAVLPPTPTLPPTGGGSVILPVDTNGLLDMEALEATLKTNPPALVSVMLVNNETGLIQPIKEIAALVHQYNGLIHCDAVQAVGKIAFDFTTLGVDMMTIAAHKVGGPVGVGALIAKNDVKLNSQMLGGGQEKRRRAGTENISAIIGFAALIENLPNILELLPLREKLEQGILALSPQSQLIAKGAGRVSNTVSIITPGLSSELQLMHLDLAGICVSAGSACSSGRIEPSHVLQAMGYDKEEASSAIRISMGWGTTELEIDTFLEAWKKLVANHSQAV